MLHRFRRAMVRTGRELYNGKVEVDESYVGMRASSKPLTGVRLRSHTPRSLVAIAIEACQVRSNIPQKCRSKFPQGRNAGIGRVRGSVSAPFLDDRDVLARSLRPMRPRGCAAPRE